MNLTLQQRIALLRRCVPNTISKKFEISEQKMAKTTREIVDALESAILNGYLS
jgi:hypothetical protein